MKKLFTFGLPECVSASADLPTLDLYNKVGQNTGNLAFHYAINRMIGTVPETTPWGSTAEQIDACGDLAIMPCANQLGSHVDLKDFAEVFSQMQSNVVAIGLGAQSNTDQEIPILPKGTLDWIQQLIARAPSTHPNITVRGDFTKRVMDHYGFGDNVVALGCPTLFINKSQNLGATLEEKYKKTPTKVAIAGGQLHWGSLSTLEASLVRIMEDTRGAYIAQATDELLAVSRNDFSYINSNFLSDFKNYLRLNLTDIQFRDWIREYVISFYNISSWIEYLRRFDFVVGTRIHGVMLGIQAGIPGLCVAHDSRITELCQKSKIPYVKAGDVKDGMVLDDLVRLSKFNGAEFDRNRIALAEQYQAFFENNGLPSFKGLQTNS